MFIAEVTVLTGAILLRDTFLLEVTLLFLTIGSFLSIFSVGLTWRLGGLLELLDSFESIDCVAKALRNNPLGQVKLILPLPRAHS